MLVIDIDRQENGIIDDDVTVCDGATFKSSGIVNGNVTVKNGSVFLLHGVLNGNLVVEDGANAEIHGTANCPLIENNGETTVSGIVTAKVIVGAVRRRPGCVVNGITE